MSSILDKTAGVALAVGRKKGGGEMLVYFKIRNSKRADEILQAIAEKRHEIDSLCYELRECLMLEAEIKKSSYDDSCSKSQ